MHLINNQTQNTLRWEEAAGISAADREKAVNEIESLLRETGAEGVENLIGWLRDSRFYDAAASDNDHNNSRGGLLCHSLNTCHVALHAWANRLKSKALTEEEVPRRSVVLASLLHDLSKEAVYKYEGGRWVRDLEQYNRGHGRRSVEMLTELGVKLTPEEATAIRWHDGRIDIDYKQGGDKAREEYNAAYAATPLLQIVHTADHSLPKKEKSAARGGYYRPLHYIESDRPMTRQTSAPAPFTLDCTPGGKFTFVGVGNICLETVIRRECPAGSWRTGQDETVLSEAGGGLGNVACNLAYLGWKASPVAELDTSETAERIVDSLKRYGVDTRLVSCSESGKTYIRQCRHCFDPEGNPETEYGHLKVHTAMLDSAGKHSRFANFKHVSSRGDAVPFLLAKIGPRPDVFFFDDFKTGEKMLAEALRKRGSLVFFEPTNHHVGRDKALEFTAVSDIVKVSRDDFANITDFVADPCRKLVVQTLDAEGARFNLRGQGWVTVPPEDNAYVVDPTGAGDVVTAAFLNALGRLDALAPAKWTEEKVFRALSEAMDFASYSVSFLGAKGLWHADPAQRLTRSND